MTTGDAHRAPLQSVEQQILIRLVALNHERAAEEKRGLVRWLRPEFQAPGAASDGHNRSEAEMAGGKPPLQAGIDLTASSDGHRPPLQAGIAGGKPPLQAGIALTDWPAELPAQVAAVRKLLPAVGQDPESLAACFGRKHKKRTDQITAILATLKALGLIG